MDKERKKTNNECFVIMPFSDCEGYEKGHFRQVYEDIIVPAVKNAGLEAKRADDVQQTNLIHLDMLKRLIDAPMCVCDLSSRNPNVLFELGIRQAFDKPVVLIQEEGTPKIFDISMLRILEYSKDMNYRGVLSSQESLTKAISATMAATDSSNANSIIKLLSIDSPAVIPQLDSENKESIALDVIVSQIAELKQLIYASSVRPVSLTERRIPRMEYDRLTHRFDRLRELYETKSMPLGAIYSETHRLQEDVDSFRQRCTTRSEVEMGLELESRIRQFMDSITTK